MTTSRPCAPTSTASTRPSSGSPSDIQTIIDVGKPLAVAVEQGAKLPSGGYEVVHSTQITAINDDDRVPILWTQGTSASDLADDIHQLLA